MRRRVCLCLRRRRQWQPAVGGTSPPSRRCSRPGSPSTTPVATLTPTYSTWQHTADRYIIIPYSWKIWRFGGLYYNCQIKIHQNFLLAYGGLAVYITTAKLNFTKISYLHMAIPYRTAKFKSTNILAIAILGSTAKFNSRQYF